MNAVGWESFAVVGSLWLAAGMSFASVLYRRGHDGWHWMPVCAVAGPLALLLVADQASFVEPQAKARRVGELGGSDVGLTVVVPAAAVGGVDAGSLRFLGATVRSVAVVTGAAYEELGGGVRETTEGTVAVLAEATQRFAPHPVVLVAGPGRTVDALVAWATEHAPSVILSTRSAFAPRTLGRLARLASAHPGVTTMVIDPAAIAVASPHRAA